MSLYVQRLQLEHHTMQNGADFVQLDDFEVFRARSLGGYPGISRSLPTTPLQSPSVSNNRHGTARTVAHRTKLLQRADNTFEIFEEDAPVLFERVDIDKFHSRPANGGDGETKTSRLPPRRARPQSAYLSTNNRSVSLKDEYNPEESRKPREDITPARKPIQRSLTVYSENDATRDEHGWTVRSFRTTRDGVINRGDSIKLPSRPRPLQLVRSMTDTSEGYCDLPRCQSLKLDERLPASKQVSTGYTLSFRVDILGGHGTGKSVLLRQLLTSEHIGDKEASSNAETDTCMYVSVDGEETLLDFVNIGEPDNAYRPADGCLVVYSVTDRQSYASGSDILHRLTSKDGSQRPAIYLVANKTDLVRGRVVSIDEGKALAATGRCKYAEVSALLALQLDDLLVSLTRDLCRTRVSRQVRMRGGLSKAAGSIVRRFLRRGDHWRSMSHDSAL